MTNVLKDEIERFENVEVTLKVPVTLNRSALRKSKLQLLHYAIDAMYDEVEKELAKKPDISVEQNLLLYVTIK